MTAGANNRGIAECSNGGLLAGGGPQAVAIRSTKPRRMPRDLSSYIAAGTSYVIVGFVMPAPMNVSKVFV